MSHALHMPSHTYTRVGYWQQSIDANVASAESRVARARPPRSFTSADYRVYAYLQIGAGPRPLDESLGTPCHRPRLDPNAIGTGAPACGRLLRHRGDSGPLRAGARAPGPKRLGSSSAPVRFPLPMPSPGSPARWERAHIGDTASVRTAVTALRGIRDRLASRLAKPIGVNRSTSSGSRPCAWLAFAAGNQDEALTRMRAAADREDATEKNAITPGPLAPARELLGEMLLAARQPAEALAAFETTLQHEPNRFRALAGAAQAARAAGNRAAAARYSAELLKLGARADRPRRPELIDAARGIDP